jgi:hypothetical protein
LAPGGYFSPLSLIFSGVVHIRRRRKIQVVWDKQVKKNQGTGACQRVFD